MYQEKKELKQKIMILEETIKKAQEMIMKSDLVDMKRVMRRLDLCEKNDIPKIKGKVACQISATDELMATELLFSGLFQNMDGPLIAAIC